DIVRTQGAISAAKDARDKMGSITDADRDQAQRDWVKAHPGQTPDENAINGQVYQNFYDQAFNATGLGTGGAVQQGIQAATAVVQGLAGGDITSAIAGGMAPYLAEQIHKRAPDEASRVMAHAVVAGVLAEVQGRNAAGAAAGAATAAIGTSAIAKAMYGTDDFNNLGETQKQTVSALATLASGLAGGLAGDSSTSALAGAQAGKNTAENNEMFSLPKGMTDYSQGASTLGMSMIDAGVTTEEVNAALSKNVKGDLPDGANITKAIVEGYTDIALVAGAAYLGPAASAGKVVGGAIISEIANGSYQWFDLSQPGNEKKTWDYKGSISAGITGALAPGRGVWQNTGMAAGGAMFTDGPDIGSIGGAATGAWVGGGFGKFAPGIVDSVTGKEIPGLIFDFTGSFGSEILGGYIKDGVNTKPQLPTEKKEGGND
ncbi:filamentous hemagglutinin, partial [Erwinia sp. 1181_3]